MTNSRITVNADDFGISPGVNRGIIGAYRGGAIHRTSAMSNMAHFHEAATQGARERGLQIGVHGTLTCGSPITDPARLPSLVRTTGHFPSLAGFLTRYLLGRIVPAEVELEVEAQINRLKAAGLHPTHLDSHHHLHYLPALSGVFFKLALRHGIPYVRWGAPSTAEAPPFTALLSTGGFRAGLRNSAISRFQTQTILPPGLVSARVLLGLTYARPGDYAAALTASLRIARTLQSELVCHPGCIDEVLLEVDPGTPARDEELRAFLDPRIQQMISAITL